MSKTWASVTKKPISWADAVSKTSVVTLPKPNSSKLNSPKPNSSKPNLQVKSNPQLGPDTNDAAGCLVIFFINGIPYFLILLGAESNKWGFPKGARKQSETAKQCAIREALEEAKIEVELSGQEFVFYPGNGYNKITLFVANKYTMPKGEIIVQESEISAYKWVTLEELQNMMEEKIIVDRECTLHKTCEGHKKCKKHTDCVGCNECKKKESIVNYFTRILFQQYLDSQNISKTKKSFHKH